MSHACTIVCMLVVGKAPSSFRNLFRKSSSSAMEAHEWDVCSTSEVFSTLLEYDNTLKIRKISTLSDFERTYHPKLTARSGNAREVMVTPALPTHGKLRWVRTPDDTYRCVAYYEKWGDGTAFQEAYELTSFPCYWDEPSDDPISNFYMFWNVHGRLPGKEASDDNSASHRPTGDHNTSGGTNITTPGKQSTAVTSEKKLKTKKSKTTNRRNDSAGDQEEHSDKQEDTDDDAGDHQSRTEDFENWSKDKAQALLKRWCEKDPNDGGQGKKGKKKGNKKKVDEKVAPEDAMSSFDELVNRIKDEGKGKPKVGWTLVVNFALTFPHIRSYEQVLVRKTKGIQFLISKLARIRSFSIRGKRVKQMKLNCTADAAGYASAPTAYAWSALRLIDITVDALKDKNWKAWSQHMDKIIDSVCPNIQAGKELKQVVEASKEDEFQHSNVL